MTEKTSTASEPFKIIALIGVGQSFAHIRHVIEHLEKKFPNGAGKDYIIFGSNTFILYSELLQTLPGRIDKNTLVLILGHGDIYDNLHITGLVRALPYSRDVITTLDMWLKDPNKDFLNVIVWSCFAGKICHDLIALNSGSTLITIGTSYHKTLREINYASMLRAIDLYPQPLDIFFAKEMLNYPITNSIKRFHETGSTTYSEHTTLPRVTSLEASERYVKYKLGLYNQFLSSINIPPLPLKNVQLADDYQVNDLMLACLYNHWKKVTIYLQNNVLSLASPNQATFIFELLCGQAHSPDSLMKLLLEKSDSGKLVDSCGNTPLHFACIHGHSGIIPLLLERSMDINTKNHVGDTPLNFAVSHNHDRCIHLLLGKLLQQNGFINPAFRYNVGEEQLIIKENVSAKHPFECTRTSMFSLNLADPTQQEKLERLLTKRQRLPSSPQHPLHRPSEGTELLWANRKRGHDINNAAERT